MTEIKIDKISDGIYEIRKGVKPCMNVPVRVYARENLIKKMQQDRTFEQGVNVACLQGIQKFAVIMPDGHQGYGFPIGGVAGISAETGVISPGGVGYDINCGVRMMRTNLTYNDIKGKLVDLLRMIFTNVPSGVGSKGKIRIGANSPEMDAVLKYGAKWAIEQGYGWDEDSQFIEENGSMKTADPSNVSFRARKRGAPQIGTLGSGNHFLEIQRVAEIYEPETAKIFGITDVDQITVMIHSGSRGLGHQVCSDYLQTMVRAASKYGVKLPDKELAAVPFNSDEGQKYFTAMSSAANFAWANRQAMMHWTREAFEKYFRTSAEDLGMHLIYDVAHNIAKLEEHDVNGKRMKLVVHRKGATRAFPKGHPDIPEKYRSVGQPVLIPGTMGTSSYLLVGDPRSMEISFGSTAHGAGRMLSRAAAKRRYYGKEVQRDLKQHGIIVMSASSVVIAEEAPGAYKNVDDVVRVSHDVGIARLVAKMVPLGVVKG